MIDFGFTFNYSRCSEGKTLGLFRRKDIVPVQNCTSPYERNYEKRYEARTVVDYLSEGKHDRQPPDNIVGDIYEAVCGALRD